MSESLPNLLILTSAWICSSAANSTFMFSVDFVMKFMTFSDILYILNILLSKFVACKFFTPALTGDFTIETATQIKISYVFQGVAILFPVSIYEIRKTSKIQKIQVGRRTYRSKCLMANHEKDNSRNNRWNNQIS